MILLQANGLPVNEALSGITGSISLASWMLLLVPQLIENFKNGSAEGISTAFLMIWFVGDVMNLVGSIWAGLLPTVILLAVYFCFADAVMLLQVLYYNRLAAYRHRPTAAAESMRIPSEPSTSDDPTQALLRRNSTSSHHSRRSRRKSSVSSRRHAHLTSQRRDSLTPLIEKRPSTSALVTRNVLAILGTCLAGTVGWFVAWKTGAWNVRDDNGHKVPQVLGAEILGYISAVLYLGARIPQIVQNYRKQSCEGLSMLFFMLSLLGNLTYGAGILFHSIERDYVMDNLPWLIGSLGTMVEDIIIFCQFRIYRTDVGEEHSAVV